jgi:hypothetical protein
MSNIINVFTAPTKVFTGLKENPKWVMPFIVVILIVAIFTGVFSGIVRSGEEAMAQQEEMLKERGYTDEQIEQVRQMSTGPLAAVFAGIGGAIFTGIMLLLFALILNLFIPLFGGTSGYKQVMAVICFSFFVTVPGMILKVILALITKSPFVTTSLALFAPGIDKMSFLFRFLNGFDFFVIWEMILVALGISITNDVKKSSAYVFVFIIFIISAFVGTALQSLGGAR